MSLFLEDRKKWLKYNTYWFSDLFTYIADMVFPGEMIIKIQGNLITFDCCRGLPPKEREMLELNFFGLGLKIT